MAYIKKYQEGGNVPAAPAAEPAQDPIQMLVEMSAQAIQSQDCQMAMQVCQGLIAVVQQAMGGGPAPVGQTPEGEPIFKKGGRLIKRKTCAKK